MPLLLSDRVAFITGGGSGIGRATALSFASEGARVVIADINETGAAETVRLVEASGGSAAAVVCNVTSEDDVKAAVDFAVAHFGRIDTAVNSAGIDGVMKPFADLSAQEWGRSVAINFTGLAYSMKYEIRALLEAGGGTIVNIASAAGLVGIRNMAEYSAGKHGVIGLTRSAAADYATSGIRINAICPGVIRTEMTELHVHGDPAIEAAMVSETPMRRMGAPSEIADVAIWLSSDRSSYVTAQAISVDGGALDTKG